MPATRRMFLAAAATLAAGRAAHAVAPVSAAQPGFYRSQFGAFELTAIYDGIWDRPVDATFVRNAPFADVRRALAAAFMPNDTLRIPFTPLLVNTGTKLVLIDTGTGGQIAPTASSFGANLAAAGIDARAVDIILISNFHPDHINGLKTADDAPVFPNAEIKVPRAEWAFWMNDGNLARVRDEQTRLYFRNARRIFGGIAERVTQFEPDREIAPGIGAIAAPGHTPGHVAFAIQSGAQTMIALCDTTNHPWLFARHPDWQPVLDMDGPLAVRTRKRILDRVSTDRTPVTGYHFPFPAAGHIVRSGSGYDALPVMWQP